MREAERKPWWLFLQGDWSCFIRAPYRASLLEPISSWLHWGLRLQHIGQEMLWAPPLLGEEPGGCLLSRSLEQTHGRRSEFNGWGEVPHPAWGSHNQFRLLSRPSLKKKKDFNIWILRGWLNSVSYKFRSVFIIVLKSLLLISSVLFFSWSVSDFCPSYR